MKAFILSLYLGLGTLLSAAPEKTDPSGKWSEHSPDDVYLAASRLLPDEIEIWKGDRDRTRLIVVDLYGVSKTYVRYDINRIISKIKWSPDSKFLLMTTTSAGGHSPWHFETYVYCVSDKSLRTLDETTGLVDSADFRFTGTHTVALNILRSGKPTPIEVDISEKASQMHKESGGKTGPAD